MQNNTNITTVIRVPCSLDKFFYCWVRFISPLLNLRKKEELVLSYLLRYRYTLQQKTNDLSLIKDTLLSTETRRKIAKDCNLSLENIQVYVSKFRKKKIIVNNDIHVRYIPKIGNFESDFILKILFDIKDDKIK